MILYYGSSGKLIHWALTNISPDLLWVFCPNFSFSLIFYWYFVFLLCMFYAATSNPFGNPSIPWSMSQIILSLKCRIKNNLPSLVLNESSWILINTASFSKGLYAKCLMIYSRMLSRINIRLWGVTGWEAPKESGIRNLQLALVLREWFLESGHCF